MDAGLRTLLDKARAVLELRWPQIAADIVRHDAQNIRYRIAFDQGRAEISYYTTRTDLLSSLDSEHRHMSLADLEEQKLAGCDVLVHIEAAEGGRAAESFLWKRR